MSNESITETVLVREIIDTLSKHGAPYRTNAGSVRLSGGRMYHGLPKGFCDILFIRDGKAHFIEAKIKPNKPTSAQLEFIYKMIELGCRAGVAYSVDDALEICGLKR